jgi:hypothetical protein
MNQHQTAALTTVYCSLAVLYGTYKKGVVFGESSMQERFV